MEHNFAMTITRDIPVDRTNSAFWLNYPDQTQAAVHLALQWLAYVYPASELHIEATLKHAQPYADADLSSRWSQFLDESDVEEHVDALQWIKKTFSAQQIPFLVETCWRLLLVDHELPSHAPLALRILGRVLAVDEPAMMTLGETVNREYMEDNQHRNRAPLLPLDPRYLDRVEWRLLGHKTTQRHYGKTMQGYRTPNKHLTTLSFSLGTLFGAAIVTFLVFGPWQLGRVKVPIMMHEGLLVSDSSAQPVSSVEVPIAEPIIEPVALAPQAPQDAVALQPVEAQPVPAAPMVVQDSAAEEALLRTAEKPELVEAVPTVSAINEPVLMTVTASILNVRSEPSVAGTVVIKLGQGARVWAQPDKADGLWMPILVEGVNGYASARFLQAVVEQ